VDVHLRDLRYFVTVAEELSFTNAAKRLYVSQPSLSRQVARLERDLRVQLLVRDRRSVALTAAGRQLLEHSRNLLTDWDAAQRLTRDAAAHEGAVLRIGQQTSIGRGIVSHLVSQLAQRHPGWRVELRQAGWADPSAGLDDHLADVAICWLPIPEPHRYRQQVLAAEDVVIALAADHRLADRAVVRFADIQEEPLLALPAEAGPLRDFWLAAHARGGRPAPVATTVATADEALDAVCAGIGGVLMSTGNADLYRRPGIAYIPVTDLPSARLAIVSRRDDSRTVVAEVMQIAASIPPG
jgi:DNA-binding transcriptional LysR family regulator